MVISAVILKSPISSILSYFSLQKVSALVTSEIKFMISKIVFYINLKWAIFFLLMQVLEVVFQYHWENSTYWQFYNLNLGFRQTADRHRFCFGLSSGCKISALSAKVVSLKLLSPCVLSWGGRRGGGCKGTSAVNMFWNTLEYEFGRLKKWEIALIINWNNCLFLKKSKIFCIYNNSDFSL